MLVLWMDHFERIDRHPPKGAEQYAYTCPELTTGSGYYQGEARISLVDTRSNRVVNTLKIISNDGGDSFDIPFRIAPGHYEVPGPLDHGEGKPVLLALKDYNGDGLALEFAFFQAEACMGLPTALLGYSVKQDRVIWYELDMEGPRGRRMFWRWVDYLFAKEPIKPGYWKYSIDYSGRCVGAGSCIERFEIRYDPEHEIFRGK